MESAVAQKQEPESKFVKFFKWLGTNLGIVFETGKGFSVEDLEKFHETALAAREEREAKLKATPVPAEEENEMLVATPMAVEKKGPEMVIERVEEQEDARELANLIAASKTDEELMFKLKKWVGGAKSKKRVDEMEAVA